MSTKELMKTAFDHLDTIAEPSSHEYKTAEYIESQLRELGYEDIETNIDGTTGLIATLDSGVEGPVLGVRSELDALSYVIDGETEYRHACGHNGHMATVLGVAKEAIENGITKGKLKIIYQPAEETMSGAIQLSESGKLNDLTHIIGMHIRPVQDMAYGEAAAGILHSSASINRVKVKGNAAHGARPHLGTNAVEGAALITMAINQVRMDPNVSFSAKVTQINTPGESGNVIPDEANMYIDIRAAENDVMTELLEKVDKAIYNAAAINGCEIEIDRKTVPAADYDDEMLDMISEAIKEEMGEESLVPNFLNPGGDDFHYYAQMLPDVKAGFIGMGADASPGLHDKNMTFNHGAIDNGQEVMYNVVRQLLND